MLRDFVTTDLLTDNDLPFLELLSQLKMLAIFATNMDMMVTTETL